MNSIVGAEYLPNAHIEKVVYQKNINFYKIEVTVSLYDYEQQTWSLDEKFTNYLQVSNVLFWKTGDIVVFEKGQSNIDMLVSEDSLKQIVDFQSMEKSRAVIRGSIYNKFKKTFSAVITRDQLRDLSCFSYSKIDLQTLKDNELLNLTYANSQSYMGSVKSERILRNGQFLEGAKIFYDNEDNIWSGPIHEHSPQDGEVVKMAGSQHQVFYHPNLTPLDIRSDKIIYGEDIMIFVGDDLSSEIERSETSIFPQATPYFHEEDSVEDYLRNVSTTTMVDIENLLLEESFVGRIMYQYDRSLLFELAQNVNLGNVEVNRFRVEFPRSVTLNRLNIQTSMVNYSNPTLIARSNNNRRTVKEKILYKVSPRKIISVDPSEIKKGNSKKIFDGKEITRDLLTNSKQIGKIQQLNLTLPKNIRPISFTDYDVKFAKEGKYKYQIKLTLKDEPYNYCKKLLNHLVRFSRNIENLLNTVIMKNVYVGDQFKISFLQEFYSQYDIVVNDDGFALEGLDTPAYRNSYLIKAFEALASTERLIGYKSRAKRMASSVNFFSTDPENMARTIEYYNKVIDKFKDVYRLSDGGGFEKTSTKKRKDRGMIEKVLNLSKTYERKLLKPIGINFISMDKVEGLPKINLANFIGRSQKEVQKFFPGLINKESDEVKSLPKDFRNIFSDLETSRYKNFTPAKIFFGSKELDTTEINPESFDADFFNTLKISRIALQNNESIEESETIGETNEEIDSYIDSREFLGNTTKFNNAVLNVLSKKPIKLIKMRKKFKFLDNKILKSKKTKISLNNFDLTQPSSVISAKIKQEPKEIPLQIKALSLLKTPMTNFDLDTIDFDPLSNPQTQEVFEQNYLNIGKIEVLEGFERVDGRLMMNKPIYKEIEPKMLDNLKEKNVLCRIVPKAFEGLTMNHEVFNIHDSSFVLNSVDRDQINAQTLSGQGQEFEMPQEEPTSEVDSEVGPIDFGVGESQVENYSIISPIDYSNTTPLQNPDNASVVSIFPLSSDQPPPLQTISSEAPTQIVQPTTGVTY